MRKDRASRDAAYYANYEGFMEEARSVSSLFVPALHDPEWENQQWVAGWITRGCGSEASNDTPELWQGQAIVFPKHHVPVVPEQKDLKMGRLRRRRMK